MTKHLFLAILFTCCANLTAMNEEKQALILKDAKYPTYVDCYCIDDQEKEHVYTVNLGYWMPTPPDDYDGSECVGPWITEFPANIEKTEFAPPKNTGVKYDKARWTWSGKKKWRDTIFGGGEPIYGTYYETYTETVKDHSSDSSSDDGDGWTYDVHRTHYKKVEKERPVEYIKGYTDIFVKEKAGWVYEVSKIEWHGTREKHISAQCKKCLTQYVFQKLQPYSTAFCLVCGRYMCHDDKWYPYEKRNHPCHCFRCISHDIPIEYENHGKKWTDAVTERVQSLGIYTEDEIIRLRENFESQYFPDEECCSCCNLF